MVTQVSWKDHSVSVQAKDSSQVTEMKVYCALTPQQMAIYRKLRGMFTNSSARRISDHQTIAQAVNSAKCILGNYLSKKDLQALVSILSDLERANALTPDQAKIYTILQGLTK